MTLDFEKGLRVSTQQNIANLKMKRLFHGRKRLTDNTLEYDS